MRLLLSELSLNEKVVQLLEAAGYLDVDSIASADPEILQMNLEIANEAIYACKTLPNLPELTQWIKQARALQSEALAEPVSEVTPHDAEIVNFEDDPEVMDMIAVSPLALPLPMKLLAAKNLSVQEIPEAILLTCAHGDVSIRIGAKTPEKNQEKSVIKTPVYHGSYISSISFGQKKEEVDRSRIRSTEELIDPTVPIPQQNNAAPQQEPIHLKNATAAKTRRRAGHTANPDNHKVLHSNPGLVWWGAVLTVVCYMTIPTGIFAAFALLLKDGGQPQFQWVPSWFLGLPLSVFVVGPLYLLVSIRARCRVCGQNYFIPRHCLKHKKAHHIPILGYVLALAMHIIFFQWFRCTFCGTPTRLKK